LLSEKVIGLRVRLVKVRLRQNDVVWKTIVWEALTGPELLSKITSSAEVGVTAPGAPPELVDQLLVVFQFVLDVPVFTQ
jgi:hypothetical protein